MQKCNPCRAFLQAPSGKVYSSADGYTFVGDEYTFVVRCLYIHRAMNIVCRARLAIIGSGAVGFAAHGCGEWSGKMVRKTANEFAVSDYCCTFATALWHCNTD